MSKQCEINDFVIVKRSNGSFSLYSLFIITFFIVRCLIEGSFQKCQILSMSKEELTVGWCDENGEDFGKVVDISEIYRLPKQSRFSCARFINARNILIYVFVFCVLDLYFESAKVFCSVYYLFIHFFWVQFSYFY
jgi:hypothetical protein